MVEPTGIEDVQEYDENSEEYPAEYTTETPETVGETYIPTAVGPSLGTGRRKTAVARVRVVPGTGEWKINGKSLEEYFPTRCTSSSSRSPWPLWVLRAPTTSSHA